MTIAVVVLALILLLEKAWRHWLIVRFFERPLPDPTRTPYLVSILQPILSGDPTLPTCLEQNLQSQTGYRREFIYLIDADDTVAETLCARLAARFPQERVTILRLPPPNAGQNPKTIKLIAGAEAARGDVLCVLDDDTVLPDHGLEQCLPFLDMPGVGLAFGLPYYAHFANVWSSLVSLFVNASSLLTYVPYTVLAPPFTINGMFYAVRRNVLASVGGFKGLETVLADDFAVAQRFRAHGWRLAQTPLRHAIRTHVADFGHYRSLLRRWFVFPKESLLRHLSGRDRTVTVALGLVANVAPVLLVAGAAAAGTRAAWLAASAFWGYATLVTVRLNARFLGGATPARWLAATPLVYLLFPFQLLAALLWPGRRVVWRGHLMEAGRGGTVRILRRQPPGRPAPSTPNLGDNHRPE